MWNSYSGTGGLGIKHTLLLQYTLLWYFVKFFMNLQSKGRRNPQKYAKEQLVLCCFCLVKYSPLVIASIMLASIFPGFLKASLRKCVPKCNFVSTFFFGSPFNNEGRKTPTQPIACSPNYLLFCWCFRGRVVGISHNLSCLDTFFKVPLQFLSEVYDLCRHLVWTQFDFAGYMLMCWWTFQSFASQMRPSPWH